LWPDKGISVEFRKDHLDEIASQGAAQRFEAGTFFGVNLSRSRTARSHQPVKFTRPGFVHKLADSRRRRSRWSMPGGEPGFAG
jgi:hypothetical protein